MGRTNYSRDEPESERLDRNFGELLQELRVAQAGIQILFAFLLTIAFQQRFADLASYQRVIYGITLVTAAFSTVLLIAPVAVHRMLFRRGRKDAVVLLSARLAAAGLAMLGAAVLCALLFVLDVVWNLALAASISGVLAIVLVMLWLVLPVLARETDIEDDHE